MVLMVAHGTDVPAGLSRVLDARRGARLTLESKIAVLRPRTCIAPAQNRNRREGASHSEREVVECEDWNTERHRRSRGAAQSEGAYTRELALGQLLRALGETQVHGE